MSALVRYQLQESVATITMDDGKANALSLAMQAELNAALDQAVKDRGTLLLTGRAGVFSAGFHLPTLMGGGADAVSMLMGGFKLAERLLAFPQPVVVACNGHALAMGVFLLLCADYSVGADAAHKIGANEVAIGLVLPRTAIEICRSRLTPAHFSRALNTAEIYRPADAVAAGFLDKVVAETEVLSEASAAASRLAKLNMPAYKASKLLVRERLLKDLRAAMESDHTAFLGMYRVARQNT